MTVIDEEARHDTGGSPASVPAGMLAPWNVGELPPPPVVGWRNVLALLGPGILLAGSSIGTGEWLFGPAVSAQYGGTLLWLATISIVTQVFANLVIMRYTLYCGEPVLVGAFRTWPGPLLWTFVYALLEVSNLWPYNASNAAVPLAAAILGHLPSSGTTSLLGMTMSEGQLVKVMGYLIFLAAFLPLIFGRTIYKTLERVFTVKLVIVLLYLIVIATFMVSSRTGWEVLTGFFRFGEIPLRADTVIAGRHFTLSEQDPSETCTVKGTLEHGRPLVTEFLIRRGDSTRSYKLGSEAPPEVAARRDRLTARAVDIAQRGGFYIEEREAAAVLTMEGAILEDRSWAPRSFTVTGAGGARGYARLEEVPEGPRGKFQALLANQGVERVNILSYVRAHGRLPDLDWAMLAAFAAIAGAGGLTNTMFSNYARDKGWGMGARVGAIPSAVGGRLITLSHVGRVFNLDEVSRGRWRGWLRHILRDQVGIWMFCCFLGMALPCMLSIEFIRNAPVAGDRVAAMTAEGMAERYPQYWSLFWSATLICGFLIVAPGQISAGDNVARRWTDIVWTSSKHAQRLKGNQVKYVYYAFLGVFCVWGLAAMAFFDPLQIAKIGAGIQNLAMGFSALHALHVNRTLLPPELRPGWLLQSGVVACGLFFFGISAVVLVSLS